MRILNALLLAKVCLQLTFYGLFYLVLPIHLTTRYFLPRLYSSGLYFADEFTWYSAAITIDPAQHKILFIRDLARDIIYLPGTKKRTHETPQGAAQRAVLERTDLVVCHYVLPFTVRTVNAHVREGAKEENEPFAVTQRMDMSASRTTMFYITKTNSDAPPIEMTGYTSQRKKTEEALWLSFDLAREILPRSSHKRIVNRAIDVFQEYAEMKGEEGTAGDVCLGSISRARNPVAYRMEIEREWLRQFGETPLLR